jgi:RNA polymerase sigma-70 factor (ECF subfamily)
MGEFDRLYEAHVAAVFRHALKCVGRRDVAEDITSEVFLTLYRRLDSLDRSLVPPGMPDPSLRARHGTR